MIRSFLVVVLSGVCALTVSGCLRTRAELEGGAAVTPREAQKQTAIQAREQALREEFDAQMREVRGRIEVLENELRTAQSRSQNEVDPTKMRVEELEKKLKLYEEALLKLEKQIEELAAKPVERAPVAAATEAKPKSSYDAADELFESKKWKEAILGFQKYRDNNPKGSKYAEATYKIGVSFQELGMKSEAKAFYEEVLEKFPKDKIAKKAKYRLGTVK